MRGITLGAVSQNYSDNSLIVHLKFDGNVDDTSGYNNTTILHNPEDAQFVPGVDGQAISLGISEIISSRSRISLLTNLWLQNISEGFSFSFWIKAPVGVSQNIFSNYVGNNIGIDIQIHSSGRMMFHVGRNAPIPAYLYSSDLVSGGALVDPDEWNHFAWTYDGDILRCYYNFSLSNSLLLGPISIDTLSDWTLNNRNTSVSSAIYDDFRVYDRALMKNEIQNLIP